MYVTACIHSELCIIHCLFAEGPLASLEKQPRSAWNGSAQGPVELMPAPAVLSSRQSTLPQWVAATTPSTPARLDWDRSLGRR